MGDVVAELPKRVGTWQIRLAGRESGRRRRQREPEAEALGSRRHVVVNHVVRVGDPERGRPGVGGENALSVSRDLGAETEIAGDGIAALGSILKEVSVAEIVVADVALHPGVVGAMDGDATVEALPHAAVREVLAVDRAHHVPVHRVPGHQSLLPHEVQLDAFDPEGAAHAHHVATEAAGARGTVALNQDVPGQESDLCTLIDGGAFVGL